MLLKCNLQSLKNNSKINKSISKYVVNLHSFVLIDKISLFYCFHDYKSM